MLKISSQNFFYMLDLVYIHTLLSICFTAFIMHGFLLSALNDTMNKVQIYSMQMYAVKNNTSSITLYR